MRQKIRFLMGNEPRELSVSDPTMTVLDYLRGPERRFGTKEGCGEGDCGACTVVLGRLSNGRLRYEAVNACIQFLPTLDGAQLLTVEDLKQPDGTLHPVQQAMVETDGSQCGFCTPGFVMSLFALYQGGSNPPGRQVIDDTLAGNLCRCTGYGPIITAAQQMHALGDRVSERFQRLMKETATQLTAISDQETLCVGEGERRLYAPATMDALADLVVAHPDAQILAGGTDVGLWVTKHLRELKTVIYLGRVADLARKTETETAIEIGAGATYSHAMDLIARHYPDMGELFRRLGSVQVRNAGTIGGNIANGSPIGDSPPPLIAAGATLHLRKGAERRSLPLEDFFIDYGKQDRQPGEFVEGITLPKPTPATRFRTYKISKRFDQDISAVCAAFSLRVEEGRVTHIRIAYGGVASIPKRASHAERCLDGAEWSEVSVASAIKALEQDFQPITDMRASAGYRRTIAGNLLRKFFIETSQPDVATRLIGAPELAHV